MRRVELDNAGLWAGWIARRLAGTLVLIALCAPMSQAQVAEGEQVRFQALVQEAVKARKAGDLERTVAMLRQAIDVRPLPEMLNNLGRVYEELGRYDEAIEVYRRVVADPEAEILLKRLDATRIELLEPRIGRAWLDIDSRSQTLSVYVDGKAVSWKPGAEVGIAPGARVLELRSSEGGRTQLLFGHFEASRRSSVAVSLGTRNKSLGRLRWTQGAGALTGLNINGHALVEPLPALGTVLLSPGRYVVEARQAGRAQVMAAVQVKAGETHDLGPVLLGASRATAGSDPASEGGKLPQLSTLGAGGLFAGVGVALLLNAEAERDQVRDARNSEGVTTLSMQEAEDLERSANTLGAAGSVLLGLGIAAAAAGTAWLLLDQTDSPGSQGERVGASSEPSPRWWFMPLPTGASAGVAF